VSFDTDELERQDGVFAVLTLTSEDLAGVSPVSTEVRVTVEESDRRKVERRNSRARGERTSEN